MADFSLSDLAANAGIATGNYAIDAANAGANFACTLYHDYPGAIIPSVGNSYLRGFWDTLCKDRPPGLPPPPSRDFDGGQCSDAYAFDFQLFNPANQLSYTGGSVCDPGPLGGLFYTVDVGNGLWEWKMRHGAGLANFLGSTPIGGRCRVYNIRRTNGQADNCGSLPPSFPPSTIPPGGNVTNYNNTYNDGTDFTFPMVYAPVSLSAPLTIDVGGLSMNFDFGGVTIGGGGSTTNNDLGDLINDISVDIGDISSSINNSSSSNNTTNNFNFNGPGSDGELDEELEDEEEEKEGIDRLAFVEILLTAIPQSARRQFGVGAPDVLYAGWFEFKKGEKSFPREPIAFEKSIFKAPSGANGFAYTLYTNFTGTNKVIKFKPPFGQT